MTEVNVQKNRDSYKRNLAIELINQRELNGFLAYFNGRTIGFCNADLKQNYAHLNHNHIDNIDDKVMSIVCITVSPSMRGQGVGTELIKAACKNAKEDGYNFIEAYPNQKTKSMYEKQGFTIVQKEFARKQLN